MRYGTVLSLNHDLEEVVDHWSSILPDLTITDIMRHNDATPGPAGTALLISFTLGGQTISVMHGPGDTINAAVSLEVRTDTQDESDRIYNALLDGGSEMACGWVTDRFGVAWQISPIELLALVNDPDPNRALAANRAMQEQRRIDMGSIRAAVEAES